MVGLIAAGLVIVFLLFFTSLLQNLPLAVLGAIIIVACISLIDIQEFRSLNLVRHSEYYLALLTVFGVLVIGIIPGIALAIALSLVVFIQSVYRPHTSVLGTEQGVDGHHGIAPGGDNAGFARPCRLRIRCTPVLCECSLPDPELHALFLRSVTVVTRHQKKRAWKRTDIPDLFFELSCHWPEKLCTGSFARHPKKNIRKSCFLIPIAKDYLLYIMIPFFILNNIERFFTK